MLRPYKSGIFIQDLVSGPYFPRDRLPPPKQSYLLRLEIFSS